VATEVTGISIGLFVFFFNAILITGGDESWVEGTSHLFAFVAFGALAVFGCRVLPIAAARAVHVAFSSFALGVDGDLDLLIGSRHHAVFGIWSRVSFC
jgi:hypothetical protein